MEALGSLAIFDDESVRTRFLAHYETVRGEVRSEIVRRHLAHIIPGIIDGDPLRVLDIGCGDGRDALWLASYGHDVIGIDSSQEMLAEAQARAGDVKDVGVGATVFELGTEADALENFGSDSFDLVLSHGVLMYHDDPRPFVEDHLTLVRPNGVLSLLTKNADSLVMRAAYEGKISEAAELLDDSNSLGHLGVSTRGMTIQQLSDLAIRAGGTVRSWAGVRIISDTNPLDVELADERAVVELEWKLAMHEPHRRVGALIHALILKGLDLSLLPSSDSSTEK